MAALVARARRVAPDDTELAHFLDQGATQVRDGLGGLMLGLALGLSLEAPTEPTDLLDVERIDHALVLFDRFATRAGLASTPLLGSRPLFGRERLRALLDDTTLSVLIGAVSSTPSNREIVPRDPGELHQELLELALVRLDARSVRFSPDGAWVPARDILAEDPALRSRWLQRRADLPKSAVQRHAAALSRARSVDEVVEALAPRRERGMSVESEGALVVSRSDGRRRAGSHYTPERLRRAVVERTLTPLVDGAPTEALRALRVCDPAMGAGDFLIEVARYLAGKLTALTPGADGAVAPATLHLVVTECIRGVDKDPVAVDLARWSLSRLARTEDAHAPDLSTQLKCGDALVGQGAREPGVSTFRVPGRAPAFDWPSEFAEVFTGGRGGFDACVGNPPWVAYAGRAAQPLEPALARYYEETNLAFHGYRTLHGLFVRRAAELLRPGGRLGLVVPTSVADLAGYGPTRAAHDELCDADAPLIDFGDAAFEAVFQPCMALTSTRRAATPATFRLTSGSSGSFESTRSNARGAVWTLARTDLDEVGAALLERLSALPVLDGSLFGERGFQSSGSDLSHLRKLPGPEAPFVVPIREGTDVAEFERRAPRTFLDPEGLTGRFRASDDFQRVEILIRQTARYPIATLSDGVAFRNSILAGFSNTEWSARALVAYLNSSPVRWYHYARHRDARQGMPQLKIGHLRALPTVRDVRARAELDEIGGRLGGRNAGLSMGERAELDGAVEDALGLSSAERELVRRFARDNPPPTPRGTRRATVVSEPR